MQIKFQLLIGGMLLATIGTGFGQPAITRQPQSCTNAVGTTASFTVGATGTEPLAYQWQNTSRTGRTSPIAPTPRWSSPTCEPVMRRTIVWPSRMPRAQRTAMWRV